MLLTQNHSDSIRFFLRGIACFSATTFSLLVVCAGVSSGQLQLSPDSEFSSAPWQESPRSMRAVQSSQWRSVSARKTDRSEVRTVSRRPATSEYKPAAPEKKEQNSVQFDSKVVQTSGDETYMLDPVPDGQMPGPMMSDPMGEPMMMPGCGTCGCDPCGNNRMYGAYCDPAISHPWQGGEYWFNPRYGLPPFMCRFPLWMHFTQSRLYFRGEYLLWWMSGKDTPPLVTTGVLGSSTTEILAGNEELNNKAQSGGRLSLGYWFTDDQCLGMEINYLGIGESEYRYNTDTDSTANIARPFTNAVTGSQDAVEIGEPSVLSGVGRRPLDGRIQIVRVPLPAGFSATAQLSDRFSLGIPLRPAG